MYKQTENMRLRFDGYIDVKENSQVSMLAVVDSDPGRILCIYLKLLFMSAQHYTLSQSCVKHDEHGPLML